MKDHHYLNINNGHYELYSIRAEDIHGNYTTLHEKDLTNFGEKIHFEVLELEENPYPNDQIELISVKSDKEFYRPNEEGEIVCGKINVHTIAAQKYIAPQAA